MRNVVFTCASVFLVGSSLAGFPAVAADHDLKAGPGIKWVPDTISVKKDDVIIVSQADPNAPHGFVFTNGTGPDAVEQPTSIPRCDQGAPAPGTTFCEILQDGQSGYNREIPGGQIGPFLRLRVLQDLSADVNFHCVRHKDRMEGTLKK